MKNIHVLPTDKPSRLCKNEFGSFYLTESMLSKISFFKNQNIYITSPNEDINENDYIITKDGRLVQVSYLLSKDLEGASKVILTDNKDLIKEGVQTIDDEFLEWFVKNPSCEEVEVNKLCYGALSGFADAGYKIIIPKEEPKQETLEEGFYRIFDSIDYTEFDFTSFEQGAKWQQEQDKKLYSEEYMLNFAWFLKENLGQYSCDRTAHFEGKYLEQFKNK